MKLKNSTKLEKNASNWETIKVKNVWKLKKVTRKIEVLKKDKKKRRKRKRKKVTKSLFFHIDKNWKITQNSIFQVLNFFTPWPKMNYSTNKFKIPLLFHLVIWAYFLKLTHLKIVCSRSEKKVSNGTDKDTLLTDLLSAKFLSSQSSNQNLPFWV